MEIKCTDLPLPLQLPSYHHRHHRHRRRRHHHRDCHHKKKTTREGCMNVLTFSLYSHQHQLKCHQFHQYYKYVLTSNSIISIHPISLCGHSRRWVVCAGAGGAEAGEEGANRKVFKVKWSEAAAALPEEEMHFDPPHNPLKTDFSQVSFQLSSRHFHVKRGMVYSKPNLFPCSMFILDLDLPSVRLILPLFIIFIHIWINLITILIIFLMR